MSETIGQSRTLSKHLKTTAAHATASLLVPDRMEQDNFATKDYQPEQKFNVCINAVP